MATDWFLHWRELSTDSRPGFLRGKRGSRVTEATTHPTMVFAGGNCVAVTNEYVKGHKPYSPPQKAYSLDRGAVPDQSDASALDAVPLVGL